MNRPALWVTTTLSVALVAAITFWRWINQPWWHHHPH